MNVPNEIFTFNLKVRITGARSVSPSVGTQVQVHMQHHSFTFACLRVLSQKCCGAALPVSNRGYFFPLYFCFYFHDALVTALESTLLFLRSFFFQELISCNGHSCVFSQVEGEAAAETQEMEGFLFSLSPCCWL